MGSHLGPRPTIRHGPGRSIHPRERKPWVPTNVLPRRSSTTSGQSIQPRERNPSVPRNVLARRSSRSTRESPLAGGGDPDAVPEDPHRAGSVAYPRFDAHALDRPASACVGFADDREIASVFDREHVAIDDVPADLGVFMEDLGRRNGLQLVLWGDAPAAFADHRGQDEVFVEELRPRDLQRMGRVVDDVHGGSSIEPDALTVHADVVVGSDAHVSTPSDYADLMTYEFRCFAGDLFEISAGSRPNRACALDVDFLRLHAKPLALEREIPFVGELEIGLVETKSGPLRGELPKTS